MRSMPATLYLIYDGECILCKNTALAFRIRRAVGKLAIINARIPNPLVEEVIQKGYNLNEGIVVKFQDRYYYGEEALYFLATIGSPEGLFNRLCIFIFSSKYLAKFCYPILKLIRNILLFIRGISPIPITYSPLSEIIFKTQAANLPEVLQKRYSLIPYSATNLLLKGNINIRPSKLLIILAPLFKLVASLPCYPGKNIPITVEILASETSDRISMKRIFYYANKSAYHFNSDIIHLKDNVVIECMKFCLAVKLIYNFEGNKITMKYGGYFLRFGKLLIPLPLKWVIGEVYAFEQAIDESQFSMEVSLSHPMFGRIYQYDGVFKIEAANL